MAVLKKNLEKASWLLFVVFALAVFPAGAQSDFGFGSSMRFDFRQDSDPLAYAGAFVQARYSGNGIKGEIKGSADISLSGPVPVYSLDLVKSFGRFRMNTFDGYYLTFTAGKAPVMWGMGKVFRSGDILLTSLPSSESPASPMSLLVFNTDAGSMDEKNAWHVSASQALPADFHIDAAYLPKTGDAYGKSHRAGLLVSKDFYTDFLKEMRLSYVYSFDGEHRFSAVADMNLLADIVAGVEVYLKDSDSEIKATLDAMYRFSLDFGTRSIPVSVYVSAVGAFNNNLYSVAEVCSAGLTDRLTLGIAQVNTWLDGTYTFLLAPSLDFAAGDGIALKASANISRTEGLDVAWSISTSVDYRF